MIDNKSFNSVSYLIFNFFYSLKLFKPLYSTYKDKGFVPEIFINALFLTILSTFAILFNASVCYIILKYEYVDYFLIYFIY